MTQIIPTAEPFLFPGGKVGCLLIHGFTGTPKEMRWMGEYLQREGFTSLGVRLAGHATRQEDMVHVRYGDWTASVEDAYDLLCGMTEHVYLIGLSMGGVLALHEAARLPVRGAVAMSTPFKLSPDWRLKIIGLLSRIQRFAPKGSEPPGSGWFERASSDQHVAYPQHPVHAVGELDRLLAAMRASLAAVRVPVLLMHSRDDHYVWQESMQSIHDALGSADKHMLWFEGSGHVLTEDARRLDVFRAAADFIRRIEAGS